MLLDHTIRKPPTTGTYVSHQLLEQFTNGQRPLFVDLGDRLIVRTAQNITPDGKPLPEVSQGDILGFELVASCGTKCKGRHSYYPVKDWRSRRDWLERRAEAHGFRVCVVSVSARSQKIEKKGRPINLDRTHFSGVLEVTVAELFRGTLEQGLSGPAKAFGRGLMRVGH